MTSDKEKPPDIEVHNIKVVDPMPPPDKRDPHTLYINAKMETPNRDRHLGAFMDSWSTLERAMLMVLTSLVRGDYPAAEVLFYSTTNIRSQTDMITGTIVLKHKHHSAKWRKLAGECVKLSNNRNHLVHGHWIPEVFVSGDDESRPIVARVEWRRVYMTGDPELNAKAVLQSEKPKTGQHRYSLNRIVRKIKQVNDLTERIENFRKHAFGAKPPPR